MCKAALVASLMVFQVALPVQAYSASGKEIDIRAETLQIEESRGEIRFQGAVTLQYEEVEMSCEILVLYTEGGEAGEVVRGEAIGEVVIRRQEDRIEAGRALFDLRKGIIELEESPLLTRGNQRISSSRMIYEIDKGIARFEGPVRARILSAGDSP